MSRHRRDWAGPIAGIIMLGLAATFLITSALRSPARQEHALVAAAPSTPEVQRRSVSEEILDVAKAEGPEAAVTKFLERLAQESTELTPDAFGMLALRLHEMSYDDAARRVTDAAMGQFPKNWRLASLARYLAADQATTDADHDRKRFYWFPDASLDDGPVDDGPAEDE